VRHVTTQLAAVRQQARQQFRDLARLAARADAQRAGPGVTLLTQAQLQTAEQRYQSTQSAADLLVRKQGLSTASATTAGPLLLTSSGGPGSRWLLAVAGGIVGLLFGLF